MTELTQDLSKLGMEDFKKRFDPDLNVNDFSAVHEAYQYLVVEYVEKVINDLLKRLETTVLCKMYLTPLVKYYINRVSLSQDYIP